MKMTLQHVHVRSTNGVDSLVEDGILALEGRIEIEEARVRLECRFEESPPYRVSIHLVTPGPDLRAEGQDHTLEAAIGKAMSNLESRVVEKHERSRRRVRSNLQLARPPGRGRV